MSDEQQAERSASASGERPSDPASVISGLSARRPVRRSRLFGHAAAVPKPMPQWVWLGDLSGFRIEIDDEDIVLLTHRCGWYKALESADFYLANIIILTIPHREEGCRPPTQGLAEH